MKVSVLQENLDAAVRLVGRAVSSRPSLQILNNIALTVAEGRLTVRATNLEMEIAVRIGAMTEEDGAITLPAKTLADFVALAPPERMDITLDDRTQTARFKAGSSVANIKGMDAAEYPPSLLDRDTTPLFSVLPQTFKRLADETVFAAAKEDNRPLLTGIRLRYDGSERLDAAAADGYRLSVSEADVERIEEALPTTVVVPARTIAEVAKCLGSDTEPIRVSLIPPGAILFETTRVQIMSQIIDGQYPNVEAIMPSVTTTTTRVHLGELGRALRRAEIFARDSSYTTKLLIQPSENPSAIPGTLILQATSQERGDNEGKLDATVEGPGLELAFNVKYLIEAIVNGFGGVEEVELLSTTFNAPTILRRSGDNTFRHIVMPMSINR